MEQTARKPITITIDPGDVPAVSMYVEIAFPQCQKTARELHDTRQNLSSGGPTVSALQGISASIDDPDVPLQ